MHTKHRENEQIPLKINCFDQLDYLLRLSDDAKKLQILNRIKKI